MKKPVPANSPCSSVPRTFTTALADLSKTSLTSRLIEVVDGPCARARAATAKNASTKENRDTTPRSDRENDSGARLEPESGLITHWRTIENVARKRRGPVSVGAVINSVQELRTQITRRDRR